MKKPRWLYPSHMMTCSGTQISIEDCPQSTRLVTRNLNIDQSTRKLTKWQLRPYELVVKIISPNAVKLKLHASWKIHDVINVSCPWSYWVSMTCQASNLPKPIVIEGESEYEVEEILDLWLKHGKLEYLIKWSGHMDDYNTWEPEANCANPCEIIEDF